MDWKERAKLNFPQIFCCDPEEIDTPLIFWMSMVDLLNDAIKNNDIKLCEAIFNEMRYYLDVGNTDDNPSYDYYTSVVIGFIEQLLSIRGVEHYIAKHISKGELLDLRESFTRYGYGKKFNKILSYIDLI